MRLMTRTRTCLCSCVIGALAASAYGQTRAFMNDSPSAAAAAATGAGQTNITANSGDVITVYAWLQDSASVDLLNAYQLIWPFGVPCSGGGSVDYININPGMGGGNSVNIVKTNPDWVFINSPLAAALPSFFNETPPTIFGVIYNYLPGSGKGIGPGSGVPHPGQPNYIAEFQLQVSADCCGDALFPWNVAPSAPPLAAIFNQNGGAYGGAGAVSFNPMNIFVGQTNDLCNDAANGGTNIPYSTCCASQDGPITCGSGGDVWYELTTSIECDLAVSITGGGSVATYVGANCTPAAGGVCGPVNQAGVAAGTHILVQISGDCAEGTLTLTCGGCTTNAECNDGNACTNDSCTVATGACVNANNTLTCSDGDVCTEGDQCGGGSCNPGPVNDCNDFNPCTVDSCANANGGDGCANDDVDGTSCTSDSECAPPTGSCKDGTGGTCEAGEACTCDCQASPTTCPPNQVCLDLRGCDNGDSAVFGTCSVDADCAGPSPDGILQCSDDDGNPLNGGICVDQCCYSHEDQVVIDIELGPTSDGACGAQLFLDYDESCLTFKSLVIDPDNETGFDFVIVNQKNHTTGTIDLVVTLAPGTICGVSSPNPNVPNNTVFLGGTLARLTFTADGKCKCGGVVFRPNNPPSKITGPKGDIDGLVLKNTDEIQIQDEPTISCPPDSSNHADCGDIFRTVVYGPVTVSDQCEEVTCLLDDSCCTVEFRKACDDNLDCGRGQICGPNTDCGPASICQTDPQVDGSGFVCDGVKCTGFCTIDTCSGGVCEDARTDLDGIIDLDQFLDCSDGCQLPPGEVTIVCSYTNGCGRTATCESSHFNSGLNELCVDIELSPSMLAGNPNDPIERCIELAISECDAAAFPVCHDFGSGFCSPMDQNACNGHPEDCFPPSSGSTITVSTNVVFGLPDNIAGHGTACVKIPPGNWTCLTARDPKHSLAVSCAVECVAVEGTDKTRLVSTFKGSQDGNETCHWLVQGNLDGDDGGGHIDIADYTILAGAYLTNYGSNDSLCKTGPVEGNNFHADFNGDGLVTLADWTFVVFNFFKGEKDPCELVCDPGAASAVDVRESKPRASMTRAELEKRGLGEYVDAADVDGDGVVNVTDMGLFLDTVQDDGSNTATIEDLKEAVRKVERSNRSRELLPRTKRSR